MEKILTVSEYCELLNSYLEGIKGKIIGEVSEFKEWHPSGHAYFSLKDENDESIINCAMWKGNYALSGIRLENGMKIIATGKPKVFNKNGRFSFVVDTLELVGEGALKKHYDELKLKLTREGLFAEERKRQIPRFIHNIGLITSARGAVIHDFQSNLDRHGFKIKFIDSLVEGQEAVKDLLNGIKTMSKQDIDVLVIMRGGGSLQSLAAFDNEVLVREIVKFPKPVIAGIGHHQDITLVALAADLAVSTPTATANYINQPWIKVNREIDSLRYNIISSFQQEIYKKHTSIRVLQKTISDAFNNISSKFIKLENMLSVNKQRLEDAILNNHKKLTELKESILLKNKNVLRNVSTRIEVLEKQINLNNPQRLLGLGYSITIKNNKVIKSVGSVIIGDNLKTLLSDGELISEIKIKNGK